MGLLDQSERDDFAILAKAGGFDPNDFELSAIEDPPGVGAHTDHGTVTVLRKSNGIVATYRADKGRSWLLIFDRDLRSRAFGVPQP